MVIEKINIGEVENILKSIDEKSIQVKVIQESLDRVRENLKLNEKDFRIGKISMEVFKDIKANLEKEANSMEAEINKAKDEIKVFLTSLSEIMNKNKI